MIDPKNDVLWRVYLLYAVMLVFSVAVIIKVLVIQIRDGEELLERANKRELKIRDEKAHRGNVFSNNGSILATSVPRYNIYFDPLSVKQELFDSEIANLSDSLSRMLKVKSKSQYISSFKKARSERKRYVRIATKVSMGEYKRMSKFPIFKEGKNKGGFIAERNYVRELPYGELAARTIGYVRENENIMVGLEGAYNEYLKGVDGRQLVRLINNNFWMPMQSSENMEPINGDDIYTSINIEIQDVAENALKKCLIENDALQGCVVLMDVKSGFIEAMASLSYNEKTSEYEEMYNFALSHNVEPGSTFKAITMLTLLENNPNMSVDDKIYLGTTDYKTFYNRTIHDSHRVTDEKGYTTIRNAFEQSSNIAFATLVEEEFKNNQAKFIEHIYKTKINEPLNLDIKGEGKPYIKNPSDKTWSKLSMPWMSFGYESTLAPIHILTFYNAIANDGVMVKPQFVKEIRHGNEVKHVFDTIVINESIASLRTIETLQELLRGVVVNGTAKNLSKLPFSVAGKTGTARISQGASGYNRKNYTASFVGYFPAEEPKYSCIVIISNPRGGKYYGSSVSGPVFKEVAEKVYATSLGVKDEEGMYDTDCQSFAIPSMVYFNDFLDYCNIENISFVDNVENDKWVKVDVGEEEISVNPIVMDENCVPELKGMNATDAIYLLESMGWKVTFTGYGKVKSQSVKAGTELEKGRIINLELKAK
ncbi:MAG: transpeptidase family protein [Bacteroidales bacterium]|nr:transpeptidase family protein [Bacteroidales bacterium]